MEPVEKSEEQASPAPSRLRWWAALPAAAAGGLLLDAATPGLAWWLAAFVGAALVLAAVWQQRPGLGLLTGFAAGVAFWMPHISWLTLYLGPIPWLGLSGVMIFWFSLFGLLAGLATRGLWLTGALRRRPWLLLLTQGVTVAGLWVAREQVQTSWPYGGFGWGRIAHTQAESPLAHTVAWTGFAGFSGFIVLSVAVVVAAFFIRGFRPLRLTVAGAAALTLLLVLSLLPLPTLGETGTLRVGAVQGDAKAGIFDDRESGDVLQDHLDATEVLLDDLERDGDAVDVIVWPENSAEFDLPGSALSGARIAQLSTRADAPIVAGSVLRDPDGTYTNSALVWSPTGDTGERYDKRYPVPFAEYMPHRGFYGALVPHLVDLVQLEYEAGTRPAAVEIETAERGAVWAGLAICFDIIVDGQATAMVDAGAEVIFAPTNNADFGRTDQSAQQLQIARLRGIETGRALVNVSTVGTSAIVAPDGEDLDRLTPHTADAMVAEVPLTQGETPALRFGALIAMAWVAAGAAGLVLPRVVRLSRFGERAGA